MTAIMVALLIPRAGLAAELFWPAVEGAAGKPVTVALMVDKVENLAGIKVVLTYDQTLLQFDKAVKSEKTAGLMHVVNDRKPGHLIVVMAGAKGVRIENEAVMNLHFTVKPEAAGASLARFAITEVQLMSDQLKDIPCTPRSRDIVIKPAGDGKKAGR